MPTTQALFNSPVLSLADSRMLYSERRTAILAQDVANADTPGFVARDLPDFASLLQGMSLAPAGSSGAGSSGAGAAGAASLPAPDSAAQPQDVPGPMTPDGNAVDVEQTLARLADTDSAQLLASELYTKYLGFFRTAIGQPA